MYSKVTFPELAGNKLLVRALLFLKAQLTLGARVYEISIKSDAAKLLYF
jgi:hypothetical protein